MLNTPEYQEFIERYGHIDFTHLDFLPEIKSEDEINRDLKKKQKQKAKARAMMKKLVGKYREEHSSSDYESDKTEED